MTASSADAGLRLGDAIRARRRLLGLTLVDLAARAGLSHPFLSQLERGLARPSMRSLTAIASGLGTSAQVLMAAAEVGQQPAPVQAPPEAVSVVRRELDGLTVDSPGGTVRTLVRGERAMMPVEYSGAPTEFHDYFSHRGEEFVYVVAGTIEVDIDGTLSRLSTGDSMYFAGGLQHRWRRTSEIDVRLVVIQQNV